MRILITLDIIDKPETFHKLSNHSVQAMLLHRLPLAITKKTHQEKTQCLYTYPTPRVDFEGNAISFHFSSLDDTTLKLVESFENNLLVRLERYMCRVATIVQVEEPEITTNRLLLRGKALVSKSREIIKDVPEIEEYLGYSARNKLEALGLPSDVTFHVFKNDYTHTFYRKENGSINLPGWYLVVSLEGAPESLKALYQVGIGQNTGTGNGLFWEVA